MFIFPSNGGPPVTLNAPEKIGNDAPNQRCVELFETFQMWSGKDIYRLRRCPVKSEQNG